MSPAKEIAKVTRMRPPTEAVFAANDRDKVRELGRKSGLSVMLSLKMLEREFIEPILIARYLKAAFNENSFWVFIMGSSAGLTFA